MKLKTYVINLVIITFLVGCSFPSEQVTPVSPDAVFTQAAETVAAELTRVSMLASPTPKIPTNTTIPTQTITPTSTYTPFFTATSTPVPCNLAKFISDVTFPDNSHVAPSQPFEKTWRLQNIGSCSWNPNYRLIFERQDGMGVASGYSQALTSGVVAPGQMVDLTVNLIAPAIPGTYTGYWRLRDPGGVPFGITPAGGTFIVKIIVVTGSSITLLPVVDESGTIQKNAGPFPDYSVGEAVSDIYHACEAFLSFDITGIPAKATITEVKINFKDHIISGDPFESLGVLNGYISDYGLKLEPADFVTGFPEGNIIDWGSITPLTKIETSPELKAALQERLGKSRLQLRLQFAGSNGDEVKDRITFNNPSLIVTYTVP